jgi:hypothetical protein
MKSKLASVAVALVLVTFPISASAGLGEWWYGESWQFVQSVGGISAGVPVRDSTGAVSLPVNCDVSGTSTVTIEPTVLNSALAVKKVRARSEGRTITLSLFTTVSSSSSPSAQCSAATLGDILPGVYAVDYRGADKSNHPVGTVVVP